MIHSVVPVTGSEEETIPTSIMASSNNLETIATSAPAAPKRDATKERAWINPPFDLKQVLMHCADTPKATLDEWQVTSL